MKRILIYIGHPAQYHFIKHTIRNLRKDGNEVRILIKTKDILEQLLQEDVLTYKNIQESVRKNTKWGILSASLEKIQGRYTDRNGLFNSTGGMAVTNTCHNDFGG